MRVGEFVSVLNTTADLTNCVGALDRCGEGLDPPACGHQYIHRLSRNGFCHQPRHAGRQVVPPMGVLVFCPFNAPAVPPVIQGAPIGGLPRSGMNPGTGQG